MRSRGCGVRQGLGLGFYAEGLGFAGFSNGEEGAHQREWKSLSWLRAIWTRANPAIHQLSAVAQFWSSCAVVLANVCVLQEGFCTACKAARTRVCSDLSTP